MSKTKLFLAILAIAGIAAYLTMKEQGDAAFGGLLAPLESVRTDEPGDPLGLVTGNSIPDVSQTNYKQMVDRVRERTNEAMERSAERSSRY
jgi:hypothetical protein